MQTLSKLLPLVLFGTAVALSQACGTIKNDTQDGREYPVKGVIRGTLVYQGPQPCTENGHVVGNAVILVFDRRNPPPPSGLANTAINFTSISGDVLFANQPRSPGARQCPDKSQIVTLSAPYAVAPMDPGEYLIQAFYDYTGNFLPTFSFRRLPELGDIGGGYIDTVDPNVQVADPSQRIFLADGGIINGTRAKASDANYQPIFLPIPVGVPGPVPLHSLRGVPTYTMPPDGYIADNITVSIGQILPLARPYFYPMDPSAAGIAGAIPSDPLLAPPESDMRPTAGDEGDYTPILRIPQDMQVFAQPPVNTGPNVAAYQKGFPQLVLKAGLPDVEAAVGSNTTDVGDPFHMQLGAAGNGGIHIWWNNPLTDPNDQAVDTIPEGQVHRYWPLVVLAKIADDPDHSKDPEELIAQGSDLKTPIIIVQGITLTDDTIFASIGNGPTQPGVKTLRDHFTVMVRPSALCLDPRHPDLGGVLATPHVTGPYAPGTSPAGPADKQYPLFGSATGNPLQALLATLQNPQLKQLVNNVGVGCLPLGRYSINVVYPTGQAWTTPNELGRCVAREGTTDYSTNPGTCSDRPRPVLYSQGNRAVVEIVAETQAGYCEALGPIAKAAGNTIDLDPADGVPTLCKQLIGD